MRRALDTGRDATAQPSKPEEVLDSIVAAAWQEKGCPGAPEGYDPGNT